MTQLGKNGTREAMTYKQRREWARLERATRPERPTQPVGTSLRLGLGWGVLFAVTAPLALAVMAMLPETVSSSGGGSGSGSGATPSRPPKPKKGLQYSITAVVMLILDAAILFALLAYSQ